MRVGETSNASCTLTSSTSHTADPWSRCLQWSPGLSANQQRQVRQSNQMQWWNTLIHSLHQSTARSKELQKLIWMAELCLHCFWRLASCWWCQKSPHQSWQSGNHQGRRQSASSGCRETLGLIRGKSRVHEYRLLPKLNSCSGGVHSNQFKV